MKISAERLTMAGALVFLVAACATGPSINSYHDYNPSVDFSKFKTFSFISDHPMIVGETSAPVSPLLEGRFVNAIRSDLTTKGFTYVADPDSADMVVSFTIGSRDQIKVDQYPASYRVGYAGYYRPYGYGIGYGTETRVRQYTEGQFAIDIFDVASKTPAYHGAASTRITAADRENPSPLLNAVVTDALHGFPPGSADGLSQPNLVPIKQG